MSNALIVVDLQQGFHDERWGAWHNPACEENAIRLVDRWRSDALPVVYVRHDSDKPDSPLRPGQPGNDLIPGLPAAPDLLVSKRVHSAFHGSPSLEPWLRGRDVSAVTIAGIQTNMCCETTARLASDLGFAMTFVLDATTTFDLPGVDADELTRATAATLAADFGAVVQTHDLLGR